MADNIRLTLTPQGAEACRQFAKGMVSANQRITEATEQLKNSFRSLSGELGIHENTFQEIIQIVAKAQEDASDALTALPPQLERTAGKIDDYVAHHPMISTTSRKK